MSKLARYRTGPFKVLFVGPGAVNDGRKAGVKCIVSTSSKGRIRQGHTHARVSVHRCKMCCNPHGGGAAKSRFLPWALSSFMCKYKYSELSRPFHFTAEDTTCIHTYLELDSYRITPDNISKCRISRDLGGKMTAQYFTHWEGVRKHTWEHEVELDQYDNVAAGSGLEERYNKWGQKTPSIKSTGYSSQNGRWHE